MGEAAQELFLTQPAVTKAIRELEDQLGLKLFNRSNRGVEPTPEARFLGDRVDGILVQMQYFVRDINRLTDEKEGNIYVGTLISASASLLPQTINILKKEFPKVIITIKTGTTGELFPALSRGDIDCVVGRLPDSDTELIKHFNLSHEVLYQEKLNVVAGTNHPLSKKKKVQFDELSQYPWILPPPDSSTRLIIDNYFSSIDVQYPENIIESLSSIANISLLLKDNWLNIMSTQAAQPFIDTGILSQIQCGEIGEWVNVGITTRKNQAFTNKMDFFINTLKEVSKTL